MSDAREISVPVETTAQAYLELLRARGIEYFFGNAGTDFGPLVDAFAKFVAEGKDRPRPMTVPHEFVAVSMAHGVTMCTGRPQVVMAHTIVGTANCAGALINAARANIPLFMTAGRTPLVEAGLLGARDLYIHWAQEAFDQAGLIREFLKWDYELRNFVQLEGVVDRALAVATSDPQGIAYLTLPREVLAETQTVFRFAADRPGGPRGRLQPDPALVEQAAALLAAAESPLLIATSLGREQDAMTALVELSEGLAIPVVEFNPTHVNIPTTSASTLPLSSIGPTSSWWRKATSPGSRRGCGSTLMPGSSTWAATHCSSATRSGRSPRLSISRETPRAPCGRSRLRQGAGSEAGRRVHAARRPCARSTRPNGRLGGAALWPPRQSRRSTSTGFRAASARRPTTRLSSSTSTTFA
jgi:hypothetical protein